MFLYALSLQWITIEIHVERKPFSCQKEDVSMTCAVRFIQAWHIRCRNKAYYYTTQAVRGPITKINQSKCSIAGPIFSKYRTGHIPEWPRTCVFAVFAFFSRVQSGAFPVLEMCKTIPWRHNMASLNSPEGTLAEFFNSHFFESSQFTLPTFH